MKEVSEATQMLGKLEEGMSAAARQGELALNFATANWRADWRRRARGPTV
jgi:hypothetical protein